MRDSANIYMLCIIVRLDGSERYLVGVFISTCLMASGRRKISFPPESVLTSVVQDGDPAELLKLLEPSDKVDINQRNHVGLTALHHGVLHNNLDAVKILLCLGADSNAQDVYGFTPLHTASACGFVHIASLLIVFGADVLLQTKDAEMPVDVAKDVDIVRLLTEVMYPRLHNEVYYSSLAKTTILEVSRTIKCFVQYVVKTCIVLVKTVHEGKRTQIVVKDATSAVSASEPNHEATREANQNHIHQE